MRSRLVRSALLAVLITISITAAVLAVWQSPPAHRLIYTEALPGGRVFQCFSDGSAIGPAGSTVEGRPTRQLPGAGGTGLAVASPTRTEQEVRLAAEEYRMSGRTPERDEADFLLLSAQCERRR